MTTKEDILNQIKQAGASFSVVGPIPDNTITEYESKLNIVFPLEYRWYLQQYGAGGIGSVNILGIDPDEYIDVMITTFDARNNGLQQNLLPIMDCDEFIYCLNTQMNTCNEYEVVRWDKYSKSTKKKADSFFDFLFIEFTRILEINQNK